MLERIATLAGSRVDFGFETTLAGRGHVPLLRKLRGDGYRIHLFFLWLPIRSSPWPGCANECFREGIPSPKRWCVDALLGGW